MAFRHCRRNLNPNWKRMASKRSFVLRMRRLITVDQSAMALDSETTSCDSERPVYFENNEVTHVLCFTAIIPQRRYQAGTRRCQVPIRSAREQHVSDDCRWYSVYGNSNRFHRKRCCHLPVTWSRAPTPDCPVQFSLAQW